MSDIFLAYADEDRERAKALSDALVQRGRTVEWEHRIPVGKSYDDVVEPQLAAARVVIALWSTHSVREPTVRGEAADAQEHEKLIPVLIDDVRPPLRFRDMRAARLVDWHGEADAPALEDLDASIATLLGTAVVVPQTHPGVAVQLPTASLRWRELLAALPANAGKILPVLGLLTALTGGAKWAMGKWQARREATDHHAAIGKNVDKLASLDNSLIVVALDSLTVLVRGNAKGTLQAYPGVLGFLAHRLPRRPDSAKNCTIDSPADAPANRAIALALGFLRENKRGTSPDSVDLSGVVIPGANLAGADLRRVNFNHACLAGAQFAGATLDGATFREADLRGADFHGATGKNVYFIDALLDTATFTHVTLDSARFGRAVLDSSGFQSATLTNAEFKGAKLRGVDFTGATLTNAALSGPDGADSSKIAGARFNEKTTGLTADTERWLHHHGACFDTLVLPTRASIGGVRTDTACQCATDPAKACRPRRHR